MGTEQVDVVIVGGGQAGLAMSYYLTAQGRSHVVLEQVRIAESWRRRRWDSLRLIAPNWSLRLPGFAYPGDDPDGFMGKDEVVTHLETYARSFAAPVQEGLRVIAIERNGADAGFLVQTEAAPYEAPQVVIATGALQRPRVPVWAADLPASSRRWFRTTTATRNCCRRERSWSSAAARPGCQIAEELCAQAARSFLR